MVEPGDIVSVAGATSLDDGELVINASNVVVNSSGNPTPEPLVVNGLETGGGDFGGQGAVVDDATVFPVKMSALMNNVGLLMKIRGKVTASVYDGTYAGSYFYVDDGYVDDFLGISTGIKDGSGNVGIKCRAPRGWFGMAGEVPSEGTYVEVLGVMGVRQVNGNNARYMWTVEWQSASFQTYSGTRYDKSNLLSLPGQPKDSNPAIVFSRWPGEPDPDLIDGRLSRWDAPAQSSVVYDAWAPDVFGPVNTSAGYWLVSEGSGSISYEGYVGSGLDQWIAVSPGWNIIGMPFDEATQWGDWKATDGSVMKSLYEASQYGAGWLESMGYWWDAEGQSVVDFGLEDDFPTTTELQPWHGYWVKVYKKIGLIAPAPQPM